MSQLLQKRASDYSVKRVPKFNLDPMFGVNECRDKALRPIYSWNKNKMHSPSASLEKIASRAAQKHWDSLSDEAKNRLEALDPASASWKYRRDMAAKVRQIKKDIWDMGGQTFVDRRVDEPQSTARLDDNGNYGSMHFPAHNKRSEYPGGERKSVTRTGYNDRPLYRIGLPDGSRKAKGYIRTLATNATGKTGDDLEKSPIYQKMMYVFHDKDVMENRSRSSDAGLRSRTGLRYLSDKNTLDPEIDAKSVLKQRLLESKRTKKQIEDDRKASALFQSLLKNGGAVDAVHEMTEGKEKLKQYLTYKSKTGKPLSASTTSLGIGSHASPEVLFAESEAVRKAPEVVRDYFIGLRKRQTAMPYASPESPSWTKEEREKKKEMANEYAISQIDLVGDGYGKRPLTEKDKRQSRQVADILQWKIQNPERITFSEVRDGKWGKK